MTNYIILVLCLLVIASYIFDITSKYTKIPGVILLIALGIGLREIVNITGFKTPDMELYLPILGTLGLILIVLEASADLKLERSKLNLIVKSITSALVLLVLFVTVLSIILVKFFQVPVVTAILNSIPLGVISSAVAIPSANHLNPHQKEFVIYESSFSDILGILIFDFVLAYSGSVGKGLIIFAMNGLMTIIVAFSVTAVLAILLHKTKYHINYIIILTFVILAYVLAKLAHLPALLLILVFGLVLSNIRFFENDFMKMYVDFDKFRIDIESFKRVLGELTFLIRSFFFLLFGYYANIKGFVVISNIVISVLIVAGIFLLRWAYFFFVLKMPAKPLVFFSPRGLITILLFLSIPASAVFNLISEEVIIMVILISILVLMVGNVINKKNVVEEDGSKGNEQVLEKQT